MRPFASSPATAESTGREQGRGRTMGDDGETERVGPFTLEWYFQRNRSQSAQGLSGFLRKLGGGNQLTVGIIFVAGKKPAASNVQKYSEAHERMVVVNI